MPKLRLDRVLSEAGVASRSELRAIIRSGRVAVDGAVVTEPETKVDREHSDIALDGRSLCCKSYRYYMMDKPAGLITASDDRRQSTVLDILPPELRRLGLFPVGRLDKDTSGLLLLTNDGDFAHRVISPKSGVTKQYRARVEGEPDVRDAEAFARGLTLGDGTLCLPAKLTPLGGGECLVTVTEGKYHQVKRMLASRAKPVLELRRLAVGGLRLGDELGPGGVRELDMEDVQSVFGENILGI